MLLDPILNFIFLKFHWGLYGISWVEAVGEANWFLSEVLHCENIVVGCARKLQCKLFFLSLQLEDDILLFFNQHDGLIGLRFRLLLNLIKIAWPVLNLSEPSILLVQIDHLCPRILLGIVRNYLELFDATHSRWLLFRLSTDFGIWVEPILLWTKHWFPYSLTHLLISFFLLANVTVFLWFQFVTLYLRILFPVQSFISQPNGFHSLS